MTAPQTRSHVGYLDGIRGLAALYVLVEHAQLEARLLVGGAPGDAETTLQAVARLLNSYGLGFGHLAVDVFIVLSGYCLMLPVVRSANGTLRGGFWGYVRRRAMRILPPYYAALFLAFAVFVVLNRGSVPAAGNLASHLFLVHNFSAEWIYGITPPLWSVAVEWHIYFVFALLLLPIWRRLGGTATLAVALLLGVVPLYLLPSRLNLEWSCPWYIVLFALGMLAAAASAAVQTNGRWTRVPWTVLSFAAGVGTIAVFVMQRITWVRRALLVEYRGGSWLLDVMVGVTVSLALLSLARAVATGKGRMHLRVVRTLESKPIALAGAFSYSLYLIHAPIMALVGMGIASMKLTPIVAYVSMYLIGIPLGLAAGYVLYLAVERHCVSAGASPRRAATVENRTTEAVFATGAIGTGATAAVSQAASV